VLYPEIPELTPIEDDADEKAADLTVSEWPDPAENEG
jgi:hypothetical protein